MTRHGPRRSNVQAYQLRAAISLALHVRYTASMAIIRCEVGQRQRGFSPQNQTLSISVPFPATAGAQLWHRQNPKSP